MYSSLRPEIRATQRVLRSIPTLTDSIRPTHCTVRSFSSYVRLQAQPRGSDDHNKPEASKDNTPPTSFTNQAFNVISSLINATKQPTPPLNDAAVPFPQSQLPDIDFAEMARKGEAEKKEIDEALKKGEIPAGYRIISDQKDVPQNLRSLSQSGHGLHVPFLLSDDPHKLVKGFSLPKEFAKLSESKSDSKEPSNLIGKQQEGEEEDQSKSQSSSVFPNNSYGSPNARRKRPRSSRHVRSYKEQTPPWLLENNVTLTRLPGTDLNVRPGVWSTSYETLGFSTPAASMGNKSYAEGDPQRGRSTVTPDPTNKDTPDQNMGGEPPASNGGHGSPFDELMWKIDGERLAREHFVKSRYFIDATQREEVLHTFDGRLRRFSDPVSNTYPGPSAANHLTIYHSAKDADYLLYQLVEDMCQSRNADLLRLDAQDISALMAQAENDPEISSRGARASFSIFKSIYGSPTKFFDPVYPKTDDAEEYMGEDEDETNPRESVEIPVASFVALPGSGMSSGFLDGIRKKVFGSGGPLSGFLDQPAASSDSRYGIFTATVDSLLSSTTRKIQSEYNRHSGARATSGDTDQEDQKGLSHRPLVIHIPDVTAIQNHSLAGAFLSELLQAADTSTRNGRHIMIVGTDCLRDVEVHTTRSILDGQEGRTLDSATAIVLTPSFAHAQSRQFLMEDRRRRIATINARHLWAVLHNGRGILLKGLEAGFWTRDLERQIGDIEFDALARNYLPYSRIQRIASILSAEDFQGSTSPIRNAIQLIEKSDETKSSYFKQRNPQDTTKAEAKVEESPEDKRLAQIRSTATKHEKKLLSGVIEPSKISTTFQDIHIAAETIETLQTLTTLSLLRPEAFRYGVLKSDRIPGLLLYGPPGTGKTLAAKAVAKESGATMLEVSAANLNDMYVGEGEKNVQALFSLAKKLSPCVVFLDEADAMFSARQAQGRRVSHRELLNQFLKEWDGMSNDSGSAFIMVATNRPMDLDDAVLRRLPRRILVDLPTEKDRLEILKIHLRHETLADDVNIADLVKKTPFYSGSDLKNVAVAAALRAVREEHDAAKKHAKENPDGEAYQFPETRILTNAHFEQALDEISASISEDMTTLKDVRKFDEQYGDKRGRRKKTPKWGFRSKADVTEKRETVKVRAE